MKCFRWEQLYRIDHSILCRKLSPRQNPEGNIPPTTAPSLNELLSPVIGDLYRFWYNSCACVGHVGSAAKNRGMRVERRPCRPNTRPSWGKVYVVTTLRARYKNPTTSRTTIIITCAATADVPYHYKKVARARTKILLGPSSTNASSALSKAGVETPSRRTKETLLSVQHSLLGTSVAVC